MRKILLFSLMLMMTSIAQAQQQATHMKIETASGTSQSKLNMIGKLVFKDNFMYLYDKQGELLGSTRLDQIKKIVFTAPMGETSIDEPKGADATIRVFFNSSGETLIVRGIEGRQTIRVYDMKGQQLQSAVASDGEAQLYLGGVHSGTLLLQVGAQVFKFLKK